nr:DUF2550 domain-containing protein [Corynebacterium sp. TAE3-ERU12]
MTLLFLLTLALGMAVALAGLLALWRFSHLRSSGLPVAIRPMPTKTDGSGWRHGVAVCSDSVAKMYKLRSLRPGADITIARHGVDLVSRRDPSEVEAGFFDQDTRVLHIVEDNGREWELAVDISGDTALVSWIESSPSMRQTRRLPVNIERGFRAARKRNTRNR